MNRLQLAKDSFDMLAKARRNGPDETHSDAVEKWLQCEVVPVVEELQQNPKFRRYAAASERTLSSNSSSPIRDQVIQVADALVAGARAIVSAAQQADTATILADKDAELHQDWIAEENQDRVQRGGRPLDTRCVVEKMTDRPWFDLVAEHDYFAPVGELFLRDPDPLLTRQYRREFPIPPLLGDLVGDMMFTRISFWEKRLNESWNRLLCHPGESTSTKLFEWAFNAKLAYDEAIKSLRKTWLKSPEYPLRKACCTLLQTYVAYHPCPELTWDHATPEDLSPHRGMLRSSFRYRLDVPQFVVGESLQQSATARQSPRIIDWTLVRSVVAALEDVTKMYENGIFPEDMINEARRQFRLVVVRSPRMVFWDAVQLDINWDTQWSRWELLEKLALSGSNGKAVDRTELTGSLKTNGFSMRRNRLVKCLMEAGGKTQRQGRELASHITKIGGGRCQLNLKSQDIKVLDMENDSSLIDPAEFREAPF